MKHILAINYTQSGQLNDIIGKFLEPFAKFEDISIEHVNVLPEKPFPFPWTGDVFWDAMPGCVLEEGLPLAPFELNRDNYDLVVFGYQVWFLSVSRPSMAILKNESFRKAIKNTPVVTIIGARNMWLNAHESVKAIIAEAGGKLVANIPLIDRNNNLISVITILYWMLTGKKKRMWGILPFPGVHQNDIDQVNEEGEQVLEALQKNNYTHLQQKIHDLGHIYIATTVMFMEMRAKKVFYIWAKLIRKKGTTERKKKLWTDIFKYYLLIALFLLSPIILILYKILILPFTSRSVARSKKYFYGLD